MIKIKERVLSALCVLSMAATLAVMPANAAVTVTSSDEWNTIKTDDCTTNENFSTGGAGGEVRVNTDYGFIWHYKTAPYADHNMKFDYGVTGDFELTFDYFINDFIDGYESKIGTADDCRIKAIQSEATAEFYNGLLWQQSLKKDNGTALKIGEYATAKRKYGVKEAGGEPTHLNVKVYVENGKVKIQTKWNTEKNWQNVGGVSQSVNWNKSAVGRFQIWGSYYQSIDNVVAKYNTPPKAEIDKTYISADSDTLTLTFSEEIGTYPSTVNLTGGSSSAVANVTKESENTFRLETAELDEITTYTADLSGFNSKKTSLACDTVVSFRTDYSKAGVFEDDFTYGNLYWDLKNMGVSGGMLADNNTEAGSSAILKGTAECGWKNFTAEIKLAIDEEKGWTMIKVRDTETFLLRTGGIWHYGKNLETNTSGENALYDYSANQNKNLPTSLTAGKLYTYRIEARNDTISITVLDGDTVLGTGSFKTEKLEKGRIAFQAYDDKMIIDSVRVKGLDSGELLNENYINVRNGDFMQLNAPENVAWSTSDSNVATVDSNGKLTAKTGGSAVITATTPSGEADSLLVFVYETEDFEFSKGSAGLSLDAMQVHDGILESDSNEGFSTLTLTGSSDCFWADFEADIEMAINGGWTQVSVRDTETFLLRNGGIWKYKGGETALKIFDKDKHLTSNKFYTYHIKGVGDTISLTVFDGDTEIGTGSYTTDKLGKGGIKITAYDNKLRIKSIRVRNLDTNDFLSKDTLKLLKDENFTLKTSKTVTAWTSSNEAVATVDASGNVTAVASGNAVITATASDGTTDACAVTVWQKPTSVIISQEMTTLKKGESIGVNLASVSPSGADKYLNWYSSDENVLKIVGNTYTRKSLKAVGEGAAMLTIKNCDDEILYENIITVMPEKDEYTQTSYASFGSEKTKIEPLLYGMHIPNTTNLNDFSKNAFNNMSFKITRSYQMNPQTDGIYDMANSKNIPQMLGLDVLNKSVDELVEDVKVMHEKLNNNSTIYVELGNELYDFQFLFDQNGDGNTDATDYVALCTPIYKALKNYAKENSFEVKVGAVLLGDELTGNGNSRLDTWDSTIMANPNFYDAVILHQYSTFNNVDGRTADEAMRYMYASNNAFQAENKTVITEFPGKEIWITEYGTLIMDCFQQSLRSEQGRLQFGNTVGMALINAEKLLDMAADGTVKMSSYHCFADSQGFGLVSSVYLPEYYTFKKIGELLDNCTYAYPEGEVLANNITVVSRSYKEVGVWVFGDENNIEYAVISNRSKNPTEFTLNGYSLSPEWSYGGGNILDGFLEAKTNMSVLPTIPEPKSIVSDYTDNVTLGGYSITVCRIKKNESASGAYISVSDKEFNPLTDKLEYAYGGTAKLYKNGSEIQSTESVNGNVKTVAPTTGFEYDTEYTIALGNTERTFRTIKKPPFESYTTEFKEDFSYAPISHNSLTDDWIYETSYFDWKKLQGKIHKKNIYPNNGLETKKTYDNFVLTFDIEPDNGDYLELNLRGGFLRMDLNENLGVRSYFNGKNDVGIGYRPECKSVLNVKIAAYNEYIYIWCGADGGEYKYVGRVANVALGATTLKFHGGGTYYLDNVVIKTDFEDVASDISFAASLGGENVSLAAPIVGKSTVSMNLSSEQANAFCTAAVYNGKKLMSVTEFNGGKADITMQKGDELKLFVWDSVSGMSPLREVFSPIADSFIER